MNEEKASSFKALLHSAHREMVAMAQAIDFGMSKDEVLDLAKKHAKYPHIIPLIEEALDYYLENTDEANEILLPYRIAYP